MMNQYTQTINASRMMNAIEKMDAITFALVVGGFAHYTASNGGDSFSHIVDKWWRWLDEMAEWLLDEDEALALSYALEHHIHCPECYAWGDRNYSPQVIDHDSDCSLSKEY